MSRIRTIKPELFSSTSSKRLSLGARWLFAALFTEADDEGRMLASARKIAGNVFPDDEDITEGQVTAWLDELEAKDGMIRRYEADGSRLLWIPSFHKHQRISHPTPSRLPPPPEAIAKSSGEVPEALGKDLGIGIGKGIGSGSGRGSDAAPPLPAPPAIDRSRQNPSAPPPRPGRIGAAGVGFMENPADFPQTVEQLLERYGAELAKAFPMLDGKSPRPSIEDAVRAKWDWYLTSRAKVGGGHANAMAVLKVDLGKIAREHTFGWEKDRGTVVESKAAAITRTRVLKPIEEHPLVTDGPVDISALMADVTAKTKARAPPSGGEARSGAPTTTGG